MILKFETNQKGETGCFRQFVSGTKEISGPTTGGQKATERALVVDFHLARNTALNCRCSCCSNVTHLELKAGCEAHRHWSSSMVNGAKPPVHVPTKSIPMLTNHLFPGSVLRICTILCAQTWSRCGGRENFPGENDF